MRGVAAYVGKYGYVHGIMRAPEPERYAKRDKRRRPDDAYALLCAYAAPLMLNRFCPA